MYNTHLNIHAQIERERDICELQLHSRTSADAAIDAAAAAAVAESG